MICSTMNKQPFRLGTGGDWGFRGGEVLPGHKRAESAGTSDTVPDPMHQVDLV